MSTIGCWHRLASAAAQTLNATLLPATCCLCGFPGVRSGFDLCVICRDLLPSEPIRRNVHPIHFVRALVPFRYAHPVDQLIRALKFQGERRHARVLGRLLADAHRNGDDPLPEALIPLPLHSSRHRTRGFNQAQEIACFAGQQLGIPVETRLIARRFATTEQSALPLAERQRNVRGAFSALRQTSLNRVALVDDVVTSGSTAIEAAIALRNAGVREIELWAIAHVAGPSNR